MNSLKMNFFKFEKELMQMMNNCTHIAKNDLITYHKESQNGERQLPKLHCRE